ncbi:MAG TPA: hypothetical protein DET40_13295 [Lentisphaeria bacterium]|nr:MAG: hypothetical protein A2X45_01390 [Lentisphaerae bacterium GWF2_50_93]HCE44516.1 hypothetical protein [Lentisphaeria bacterium]
MRKTAILAMVAFVILSGCKDSIKDESVGKQPPSPQVPVQAPVPAVVEKAKEAARPEIQEKPKVEPEKKAGGDQLKSFPEKVVPLTLGMQTKPNCSSTADLQDIGKLGVKFIRRGFYWDGIEKEKGKYEFTEYDRILKDADDNGLRVLACLFGNNKLHEDDNRGGIQTEEGRKGYANFAAALASHFKGRGIIWEIWNEPNVRTFWRNDKGAMHNSPEFADEYTALVKETVKTMRLSDPDCLVVAGSVSCFWDPSFNWTDSCFSKGMYKTGISGWSVHPYGLNSPEEYTAGYERMRSIMEKYGAPKDFPMLNTERGFAVAKTKSWEGNPESEGWSGGPEGMAFQYQSWHIVRQYMIDLMNGINLSSWYEWAGKEFAIASKDKKRPAYFACKNMIDQLSGFAYKERMKTASPLDYVLIFVNKAGAEKLVVWTSPPLKATPEKVKDHDVAIPVNAAGELKLVDLMGKESVVKVTDGKISVKLSGAPQYVVLK